MAASGGDHMHGRATVEHGGFVRTAQVVESQSLETEFAGLTGKSFVRRRGRRGVASDRSTPCVGGLGNIRASAGNWISERSTAVPSGRPATRRKYFSRLARSKANKSSSIVMVRLWLSFFGPLRARECATV